MNTQDGKWIIDKDSPLLDQIAVEMPDRHFNPYMTLRELIEEYRKNDDVSRSVEFIKGDIERLLERLKKVRQTK